jgi:hypothetical protein
VKITMHNDSKPWTPEMDEVLRKEVIAGTSLFAIAKKLGRKESAVKSRAYTLQLSLRPIGTRRREISRWG